MKSSIATLALLSAVLMPSNVVGQLTVDELPIEYTGVLRVVNMAPMNGTCQTPVWVGLHNGNFDMYDLGSQASASLEALAEDGVSLPLVREFDRDEGGVWDAVIGDGPICPGDAAKIKFNITILPGESLYLSYASMVLPSNDAFVGNDDPMAHMIFNSSGLPTFEGLFKFRVYGDEVLDAGTELNDELPENTAFFGQRRPNQGVSVIPFGGVVAPHPGFKDPSQGGILSTEEYASADFTVDRYKMMRIAMFFDGDDSMSSPDDDTMPSPDDDEVSPDDDMAPIPVDGGMLRRRLV